MHTQLLLSYPTLCDPVACTQALLSMGFSRHKYWSGLPFPAPGIFLLRDRTYVSCIAGGFFTTEPPRKPTLTCTKCEINPAGCCPERDGDPELRELAVILGHVPATQLSY